MARGWSLALGEATPGPSDRIALRLRLQDGGTPPQAPEDAVVLPLAEVLQALPAALESVASGYQLVVEGECFPASADQPDLFDLTLVRPCASPHRFEVTGVLPAAASSGGYPGDVLIEEEGRRVCSEAVANYLSGPVDEVDIDYLYVPPTEDSWAIGDTDFICLLPLPEDRTGSVKGLDVREVLAG
jgi:hypothetical protein